jgi:hypothetical protein
MEEQMDDISTILQWTPDALQKCLSAHETENVLEYTLTQTKKDGYWLEFGVASGKTLRSISSIADTKNPRPYVVGFDSFDGLPEDWANRFKKGTFSQKEIPNILGAEIIVGLFEHTLIPWVMAQKTKPLISLLHIDCDLYSGTKYVLSYLAPLLVPGSFVIFDELINYEGFELHEWKALYECAIKDRLFDFEWVAYQKLNWQNLNEKKLPQAVAIRIINTGENK